MNKDSKKIMALISTMKACCEFIKSWAENGINSDISTGHFFLSTIKDEAERMIKKIENVQKELANE